MKPTFNIVFFITTLDSGGLENYLLRFLEYKAFEFNRIIVFCKGGKAGQLQERYQSISNVEIYLKEISFFNPADYLYIYNFFKKNQIESVCDFTGNFAGLILYIAYLAGIKKRVTFYRGSSDHFINNSLKRIYNNFVHDLVYKYSTDILSNSRSAFNYFFYKKWENNSRFEVIYNGINPDQFVNESNDLRKEFNIPSDAFVVGHTGRFNIAKNHATILKVAEQLVKEKEDIYFILCGNKVKNKLQQEIINKNLSERILLFENRKDIPKFLNTMDCYYFPSLTEGQPNALIEAMLMNVPVVASNIPPIMETVPDNLNNFLVEPLDVEGSKSKILEIKNGQLSQNLQDWTIKTYNANVLFQKFYNRLK